MEPKFNPKPPGGEYVQKKDWSSPQGGGWRRPYVPTNSGKKSAEIAGFQKKKSEQINRIIDQKEISILTNSACRDSAALARTYVEVGFIKPDEYDEVEKKLFWVLVEKYHKRVGEVSDFINEMRGAIKERDVKSVDIGLEDAEKDAGEPLI